MPWLRPRSWCVVHPGIALALIKFPDICHLPALFCLLMDHCSLWNKAFMEGFTWPWRAHLRFKSLDFVLGPATNVCSTVLDSSSVFSLTHSHVGLLSKTFPPFLKMLAAYFKEFSWNILNIYHVHVKHGSRHWGGGKEMQSKELRTLWQGCCPHFTHK